VIALLSPFFFENPRPSIPPGFECNVVEHTLPASKRDLSAPPQRHSRSCFQDLVAGLKSSAMLMGIGTLSSDLGTQMQERRPAGRWMPVSGLSTRRVPDGQLGVTHWCFLARHGVLLLALVIGCAHSPLENVCPRC